jgi:hypothetical protein
VSPGRAWEWTVVILLVVIAFSALAYMVSSSGTIPQ